MQTYNYYQMKLLMFDSHTWNHLIVCKSFVLRMVTWIWRYNCLLKIVIIRYANQWLSLNSNSYFKPYVYELFVLGIFHII